MSFKECRKKNTKNDGNSNKMAVKRNTTKRHSKKKQNVGKKYSSRSINDFLKQEHHVNQETEYQISTLSDEIALKTIVDFSKDNIDHNYKLVNVKDIFNEKHVGLPLKFIGYIYNLSEGYPQTKQLRNSKQRFTVHDLTLQDQNGSLINVFPIIYDFHKDEIEIIKKRVAKFTFYGTVVSIEQMGKVGYEFLVSKIDKELPASELLDLNEKKKEKYNSILEKVESGELDLKKYIKNQLVKNIGIKGINKAEELSVSLDFAILQSFSNGKSIDGRYSNKLHSLIIGPPAVGKKLITQSALALNTHNFEIPPTAAKVTPAGLIGNVIRKSGAITTKPGILSIASNGVVCIQDFHELAKKKSSNFSDIFSKVMEDGEVIDSTSSRTVLPAITSIHLDMNRQSQVNGTTDKDIHSDLKIPLNILSRFDFIIDIPYDIERQIKIVFDMMKGNKLLGNQSGEIKTPEWIKELRYLIEKTKEKNDKVIIPEDITVYAKMKLEKIIEGNSKYLTVMKNFGSMLTRMQVSLEKILKSIATSEMCNVVKEEHVDEAFRFLTYKLQFLQNLDPIEVPKDLGENISEPKRREEIILKTILSKSSIKTKDLQIIINKEMKKNYDIKTIQRDLKELNLMNKINNPKKGIWSNAQ
jgi:hypothetical protein